jgi:hypothetical protein
MALPHTNTTCDIYRSGNSPPADPDVAGVKCLLEPSGQSTLTTDQYSHVLLVPATTDIRDGKGTLTAAATNPDKVYVPDRNGTLFTVVLVRRKGRGTPLDHKFVLVQRTATPIWPTDEL